METTNTDELSAIAERAAQAGADGAPVHLWDPSFCGAIDIRIASDGRWFYRGTPIEREALVRLFASVLKVEDDGNTYLVTPAEKLQITVDAAHFIAVAVERSFEAGRQRLTFRTNLGTIVTAGLDHPVLLPRDVEAEFAPLVTIRGRLLAKATRSVAMELADWLEEDEDGSFLMSDGFRFDGPRVRSIDE